MGLIHQDVLSYNPTTKKDSNYKNVITIFFLIINVSNGEKLQ